MQRTEIENGISFFASCTTLWRRGDQSRAFGSPGKRPQLRKGAQNVSTADHGQNSIYWEKQKETVVKPDKTETTDKTNKPTKTKKTNKTEKLDKIDYTEFLKRQTRRI